MKICETALVGLALLALASCDDPAKDKAKAITTEATASTAQAASAVGKAAGTAVRYDFDSATSKVEWVGSKVTGKHDGGFKQFKGTVSMVDGAPEKSSVTVDIDTDSLFADQDKLVGHLKTADFFDVAKFPKATFTSTEVKKNDKPQDYIVTGSLSLHGVTKSISFPATIRTNPSAVDVAAEFAINRKDFGLAYAGKADDLIRDDVVIKLTLHASPKAERKTPELKIPADYHSGYLANSMLVTKEPNKTGLKTGVHLVYINPIGFDRLKNGGSTPYPDGTVFVDDVRQFSVDDGAYQQGAHKFITVMVKDSNKYGSTGGWGFQAWLGGDPTKPIVDDSVTQCFTCHVPNKSNDYVFSTYLD
jgi:polyisoprenoid-binding protein YceI